MENIIAVAGSVTTATRLAKEMNKMGYMNCRVVRTPMKISDGGCSYSVETEESLRSVVLGAAAGRKISLKGIYKIRMVEGEKVYDDIS